MVNIYSNSNKKYKLSRNTKINKKSCIQINKQLKKTFNREEKSPND